MPRAKKAVAENNKNANTETTEVKSRREKRSASELVNVPNNVENKMELNAEKTISKKQKKPTSKSAAADAAAAAVENGETMVKAAQPADEPGTSQTKTKSKARAKKAKVEPEVTATAAAEIEAEPKNSTKSGTVRKPRAKKTQAESENTTEKSEPNSKTENGNDAEPKTTKRARKNVLSANAENNNVEVEAAVQETKKRGVRKVAAKGNSSSSTAVANGTHDTNKKSTTKKVAKDEPAEKSEKRSRKRATASNDVEAAPKEPVEKEKKKRSRKVSTSKALPNDTDTTDKNAEENKKSEPAAEKAKPKQNSRKRAVATNDEEAAPKAAKVKKTGALLNEVQTAYNSEDFGLSFKVVDMPDEELYNLKISSWNVAGLRSWLKKDGLKFVNYENPDIFCLQETKCTSDQLPEEAARIPGYHPYWLCMPGGYAGVALYSKIMPINVEYGIKIPEFDDVGRMITAEYEKFFLVNVYVPNSGRKLVNLNARMRWEDCFRDYIVSLDKLKPVIICGDMNVSHMEIDLANPKSNTRNAGFTKEEREKMSELLAAGFIDTYRHFYPEHKGSYTFWTYMGNARSRNVGWRLDYFIVSSRIVGRVVDNCIRSQCMGSDHCPITLFIKV